MAYNPISNSEVAEGSPLDSSLLLKIKANFEAQQVDLASKQSTIQSMQADLVAKQAIIDSHAGTLTSHGNILTSHASSLSVNVTRINKQVPVGTVRSSTLSLVQFQTEVDGVWMLMNGQSCVGTAYASLTGNATVPDVLTDGEFLRQAKVGRNVGTKEGDAIRNITATTTFCSDSNGSGGVGPVNPSGAFSGSGTPGAMISDSSGSRAGYNSLNFNASLQVPTSDENRPKNLAVNFFIKVGY